MKKRVVLSILAACIVLSSGCSRPVDNQTGELNTKAEVTFASGEVTEPISDEPVESGIDKEQPTTQETAETTDVSVEPTIDSEEATTPATDEPVTEEPTEPAIESVTEPVTEPAAEVVIPTQSATQKPTAAPAQPAIQKPTTASTQSATQKPTNTPIERQTTEVATQKQTEAATEAPTTAPAPIEEATEAPTREKTAWDYPWDLNAIEAELRAYGESLGMTYYDEEYVRNDYLNNPQVQQWWTLEEWMQDGILTPDNANWNVPVYLRHDDNEYFAELMHTHSLEAVEYLAERGTEGFRIYCELDETGKSCCIYTLY